jgi:TonB-dependent starch-binding outer membrane protein SusC
MKPNKKARPVLWFVTLMVTATGCASTERTAETNAIEADAEAQAIQNIIAAATRQETGWKNTISGEIVADNSYSNVEELLIGRFSGVQVTYDRYGNISVRIRGASSLLASQEPLYVVDGVRIMSEADGGGLQWLNPYDIATIQVLKDADSKALYGANGAAGVILITTKKRQ